MDRLNTEYEEETTRVKQIRPAEKAAWERRRHEDFKIEMRGFNEDTRVASSEWREKLQFSLHLLSNFSEMVSLGLYQRYHLDKLTKQGLA